MSRTIFTAAALLAGVGLSPLAGQYPTSPPDPMPMRQLQLPPFEQFQMPNGLDVVLVRDASLPLVILSLSTPGGSANDPPGKEGLADLVGDVMLKGTTNRTAEHIAAEIEGVGATLNAGAGTDFFSVGTAVLKEHVHLAFELVSDVLINATFPEDEVALSQQRFSSSARVSESQPSFLAGKFFNAALYGEDHPYGRTATAASYEAATRDDVAMFAERYIKPDGAILVLAGDLTAEEARALTRQYLGSWQGRGAPVADATPREASPTEIILVNRPGSAQSNILVGNLTMRPGDDDYYAAVVANRILGGGGDARLFQILREEKGWTYGAYSSHNRPRGTARFQASTEVRTEVTDSALTEILHQIERMRTEPVPAEELAAAKGFLLGSFPLQIQTPQQVAGQVRTVKQLGLGDDYLTNYRTRLAAVGSEEVLNVSRRIMRPDSAVIVVVGDGQALYDGLAAIAPVRIVDANGNSLTVADLNPTATAVAFDASRITSRRDSFTVIVQGTPYGHFVLGYDRNGDAVQATREMVIPGLAQQADTLTADAATLAARSFRSSATQQGQTSQTSIEYSNGRVTGTTTTPGAAGPETVAVDEALEDHVIEANALALFIGALDLTDGASWTVDVFESSQNAVGSRAVSVSDAGMVTVPGGAFDAWMVTIQGNPLSWEYYVDKGTGTIIKLVIVGQPLSFELVSSSGMD